MIPTRALVPILLAILSVATALSVQSAAAQTYPNRPITLIVPYAAGGTTDAIARVISESMSQSLGQQVVIETVGGAGGTICAARVDRGAPDGYTILLHQPGLPAGMTLYNNLTFDAAKDFTGIGMVNTSGSMVTGRASLPANSLPELVRWMKEPGRTTKMAHAGVASYGHLCGVMFVQAVGAAADQIPYRGAGPALNDLVAGHADLSCQSPAVSAALVKSGQLKGFGILGKKRFAGLPDVVSLTEAGYKGLDLEFWHALFAPTGTPRPIVDRLNAALRQSFADAKVRQIFDGNGMDLYPAEQQTPEAASALLISEIKRWGDVIRVNNITAQ